LDLSRSLAFTSSRDIYVHVLGRFILTSNKVVEKQGGLTSYGKSFFHCTSMKTRFIRFVFEKKLYEKNKQKRRSCSL